MIKSSITLLISLAWTVPGQPVAERARPAAETVERQGTIAVPADAVAPLASEDDTKRPWGEPVQGQAICVAVAKPVFPPGEPILLNVCLKNVGNEAVTVVKTEPLAFYEIDVVAADGKTVPQTLFGRDRLRTAKLYRSREVSTLKPGEEVCAEVKLSRLFDLSRAGTYRISARTVVWADDRREKTSPLTSQPLEITVDDSLGFGAARFVRYSE